MRNNAETNSISNPKVWYSMLKTVIKVKKKEKKRKNWKKKREKRKKEKTLNYVKSVFGNKNRLLVHIWPC